MCRPTEQGLSYMTVDDIETVAGYPRHNTSHHVQTLLLFHYQSDSELCRAVNAHSRRRRQAEFTDNQRVVSLDLVNDVLNYQA